MPVSVPLAMPHSSASWWVSISPNTHSTHSSVKPENDSLCASRKRFSAWLRNSSATRNTFAIAAIASRSTSRSRTWVDAIRSWIVSAGSRVVAGMRRYSISGRLRRRSVVPLCHDIATSRQ